MSYRGRCTGKRTTKRAKKQRKGVALIDAMTVIKDVWALDGMERPWWAKLARDRHWISWAQYYAVPRERTGKPTIKDVLYSDSPLFSAIRKDTTFGAAR